MTNTRLPTAPKASDEKRIINTVKTYITQPLIALLGMLIYHEFSEMRDDIKTLIPKVAQNEIRIQRLEEDVKGLKSKNLSCDFPLKKRPLIAFNMLPAKKEDELELEENQPHEP